MHPFKTLKWYFTIDISEKYSILDNMEDTETPEAIPHWINLCNAIISELYRIITLNETPKNNKFDKELFKSSMEDHISNFETIIEICNRGINNYDTSFFSCGEKSITEEFGEYMEWLYDSADRYRISIKIIP